MSFLKTLPTVALLMRVPGEGTCTWWSGRHSRCWHRLGQGNAQAELREQQTGSDLLLSGRADLSPRDSTLSSDSACPRSFRGSFVGRAENSGRHS